MHQLQMNFLFEPDHEKLDSLGLNSLDALVTCRPGGTILVPMQNNLSVAAHLEAGMCIGSVAPVPDSINEPPSASIPIVSVESLLVLDEDRAQMVLNALALEQGDLTDQQFAQLVDLVQRNADLFPLQDRELGHTDVVKHSVDTGDHHPI